MRGTAPGRVLGVLFFFFNDTATTEIYTLSLHDALPICSTKWPTTNSCATSSTSDRSHRSEEHTSELQSQSNLVCRLLLEKKRMTNSGHGFSNGGSWISLTFGIYCSG